MNRGSEKINNIFQRYFDIIDEYFGSIKHYLGDKENSHVKLGETIASYPLISNLVLDAIDDISIEIYQFWKDYLNEVIKYVKNQEALKCLYSGKVTPPILENFIKRAALYVDTIILPDPLFNLAVIQKKITKDKQYYLYKLISNVFNIWKLRELIFADTEEKIIIILPISLQIVNASDQQQLRVTANKKYASYISQIFNRDLKDSEACIDFLTSFKKVEDIHNQIKDYTILPTIFKDPSSLKTFLTDFSNTSKYTYFESKSIGWYFGLYLSSEFTRVQEHKFFCERLIAEPIYDDQLPWYFFNYDIGGIDIDAAVANVLQKEKFKWITSMSISTLRELREKSYLDYWRDIMRHGITGLKAKNDKELIDVSKQLQQNIYEAFKKQQVDINELKIQESNIKEEIATTTTLSVLGKIPMVGQLISIFQAGRDIYNLLTKQKEIAKKREKIEDNFVSILLKIHEGK